MKDIFKHLCLNRSLDGLNLKKRSGKWDLTNLSITKPKTVNEFEYKNSSVHIPEELFRFKDIELQDVDLSHSTLDYSIWENCTFNNALFNRTSGKNIKLYGCNFYNTLFENVVLKNSLLGGQFGFNSGKFNKVKFLNTNLMKTYYTFPTFNNCEFINCNLKEIDFDGSRFIDCSFESKLDSVFFKGYSEYLQEDFINIPKKELFNPMKNVNFSKAEMFGVSFLNQIDLSTCLFPISENYLLIKHFPQTYNIAKERISLEWMGKEKEMALNIIDNVYLSDKNSGKKIDFIDKNVVDKMIKITGFADKLFSLLKNIEETYFK